MDWAGEDPRLLTHVLMDAAVMEDLYIRPSTQTFIEKALETWE